MPGGGWAGRGGRVPVVCWLMMIPLWLLLMLLLTADAYVGVLGARGGGLAYCSNIGWDADWCITCWRGAAAALTGAPNEK